MWTILIAFLVGRHVLPERLLALLAHESHLEGFGQWMGLRFSVAFRTVVPGFATGCSDGDLRVEDMFAVRACLESTDRSNEIGK